MRTTLFRRLAVVWFLFACAAHIAWPGTWRAIRFDLEELDVTKQSVSGEIFFQRDHAEVRYTVVYQPYEDSEKADLPDFNPKFFRCFLPVLIPRNDSGDANDLADRYGLEIRVQGTRFESFSVLDVYADRSPLEDFKWFPDPLRLVVVLLALPLEVAREGREVEMRYRQPYRDIFTRRYAAFVVTREDEGLLGEESRAPGSFTLQLKAAPGLIPSYLESRYPLASGTGGLTVLLDPTEAFVGSAMKGKGK